MLKNYFKIALRNLLKSKLHTTINILGLGIGLAACILITLFASHHMTYDSFHENADSVYQVYKERMTPTGTQITRDTWLPMAPALKNDYSTILNATRTFEDDPWIEIDGKRFQETVRYIDRAFFEVFTFSLAQGNAKTVFADVNAAVISQEIARKYFGDSDPIGRVFSVDFETDYVVRGIMEEVPANSTITMNIALLVESTPFFEGNQDNWGGSFLFTYVQLADGVSQIDQESQFPSFVTKIWEEELNKSMKLKLTPLPQLHNELTNANAYVNILLAVAFVILVIASINFMNLTNARSIERGREIGVRKVLGAMRQQLIRQFLMESVIISLLALAVGIGLLAFSLPVFNSFYGLDLGINYLDRFDLSLILLVTAVVVGLFSGLYPAAVLSKLLPAQSLKGGLKASLAGRRLRAALVVTQFSFAIVLIIGTGVMWKQIQYMKNANLNFNKENVINIAARPSDFRNREEAATRLETFRKELKQISGVVSVASSTHVPGRWPGWFSFVYPTDREDTERLRMRRAFVDANFFKTYDIELVEGRGFSEGQVTDVESSVILNEAALRDIGWPQGAIRQVRAGGAIRNVIGIVKDYHYQSLASEVAPVVHFYRPTDDPVHRSVSVRIHPANLTATIDRIGAKWRELNLGMFDFTFVDDTLAQLYEEENRLATVAGSFTILAIIVACLGLFALASLTVSQRTKEIGIRKTLGATVNNLVFLIAGSFTKLVGVAFVIACPIAYFASDWWLADFAYRTSPGLFVFLLAGVIALAAAMLMVSYHSIRTALTNPVETLRYE